LINKGKILIDLQHPQANRPCIFLEGKNAREQAKRLYAEHLKQVFTL